MTCSTGSTFASMKKHDFAFITGAVRIDDDKYNSLVSTIDGDGIAAAKGWNYYPLFTNLNKYNTVV